MMKRSLNLYLTALLACCLAIQAASAAPRVGKAPPPLDLEELLQSPTETKTSWAALKGKVVVLEFWATWCAPCIEAIPHLNELAEHFKDQPIQFIAITDESDAVVRTFLKKKPIHAWVGLDTDRSVFTAFGVEGIPQTVVIDREGLIAAIISPTQLIRQDLEGLLAGKKLDAVALSQRKSEPLRPGDLPGNTQEKQEALFQVLVRPSALEYARSASGDGSLSILGMEVLGVLASSHRINPVRVITNCTVPAGRFDFVVKIPTTDDDDQTNADRWLRQAIETTFGLNAKKESREMEVFVLNVKKLNPAHLALTVSTGGSSASSGRGRIQAISHTIGSLAWYLESALKTPVVDETQLSGDFDFDLKWKVSGENQPVSAAIIQAAREQLGLELTRARRIVEVLMVEKSGKENR